VSVSQEVLSIYGRLGSGAYFGERVSMLEHGLQAAHFAKVLGAPDTLVIAALLHDVGHLLEAVPEAIEDWISDARHEVSGARWLAQRFAPAVSEPVRLHVPAKRYLRDRCRLLRAAELRLGAHTQATGRPHGGSRNLPLRGRAVLSRSHRGAALRRSGKGRRT
jgi:hypothetical protein